MTDKIILNEIELRIKIGDSPEERAFPQRIVVCASIKPIKQFDKLEDKIANAVDYVKVIESIRSFETATPRELLETLAVDMAELLLKNFPLTEVKLEARKFVMPGLTYTAAKIKRYAKKA